MQKKRECYCGDPDICTMACSTRGGRVPTSWPPLDELTTQREKAKPLTAEDVKEIVLDLLRLNRLIR